MIREIVFCWAWARKAEKAQPVSEMIACIFGLNAIYPFIQH